MNIVIPAAGLGSRFVAAGYSIPKPFIPIKGKCMIEHVVDNLTCLHDKVYLVLLQEHVSYLASTGLLHRGNVAIIPQQGRLQGAVESVLLAKSFINNDEPLIIANSDQWLTFNSDEFRASLEEDKQNVILTFKASDPRWSYAALDHAGDVERVAEKEAISEHATVGVYGFAKGKTFVWGAQQMQLKNTKVNGEFYVCPVFNELIRTGYKTVAFPVDAMYGLGTPEDLVENYNAVGDGT